MQTSRIRVHTKGSGVKTLLVLLLIGILFTFASVTVNLDLDQFISRLDNVPRVLSRLYTFDVSIVGEVLKELTTSVSLAFLTLVVSVFIAIFLSFLAAENSTPHPLLAKFIKGVFAIIRAIPGLVFGLMVIASLGFGNTAGFIALFFSTIGSLIKMFTGSIEDIGDDVVEAMKSTGASWFNVVFTGLLPLVVTSLIAWVTVRFEGNIAEAISLGIIGVGGVGLLLTQAIGSYNYSQTTTIVVIICLFMLILEVLMTRLKKKMIRGS